MDVVGPDRANAEPHQVAAEEPTLRHLPRVGRDEEHLREACQEQEEIVDTLTLLNQTM